MEEELKAITENIQRAFQKIKEARTFKTFTAWQINPYEKRKGEWLGQVKDIDSDGFFDIQQELNNQELYDQVSINFWNYIKELFNSYTIIDEMSNIIQLEIGKFLLYVDKVRAEDYTKFSTVSEGLQKIEKTILTHDIVEKEKQTTNKTIEELQKELEFWRKKNEEAASALKEITG